MSTAFLALCPSSRTGQLKARIKTVTPGLCAAGVSSKGNGRTERKPHTMNVNISGGHSESPDRSHHLLPVVQQHERGARAFMRLHAGIHSFSEAGPGRWAGLGAEGGRTRSFDFVSRAGDCPPPTLHPIGLSPFCALHMTRHEQDCFSSNPGPGLIAWASQAAFLSTTFPAVGTLPSPPAAAQ